MSSSISGSAILEPTLARPALSSSSVTRPLLSVSMSANISLITSTSSADRCSAMTCIAFFLKRFMMENCFSLARTTSPSGTFVEIEHGYRPRTWRAVRRLWGSISSIWRTRLLALSEIQGQGSWSKLSTPRSMERATPCSVSAQKGGTPQRRM
ncbi:hypothetical protein TRIUR3_22665 [Triticum urartu]|uniref:Uncharacterized protein n=1 Tax=Triticum urartu TaxID=4572 RepID=M8A5I0_TRIUA|nr:hypothetical protein TRIUR3_22665 [Triticum urartu]